MDKNEKLWTRKELAEYLGLSEATIRTYVTSFPDRLPPRMRNFRKSRWNPKDVQEWAAKQSVPPDVPEEGGEEKNGATAPVGRPLVQIVGGNHNVDPPTVKKARRGRPRRNIPA
ncbi:helix-turn-helix transcriptional regulator [Burkholderia ubonensis]|uniref:helix-turn-helix transcriptional regulator n=1 Tax=Burkholderia ubonensis TaxID=101571 RepID=UPI000F561823|nr:helix-turn-helix domain-containing protein [Burkholderia ubonensis]